MTWWFLSPSCSGHGQEDQLLLSYRHFPKSRRNASQTPSGGACNATQKLWGNHSLQPVRENNELRNSRTDKSGEKAKYSNPYLLPTRRRPNLNPVSYLLKGATKKNNFEDFFAKIVLKGHNIFLNVTKWLSGVQCIRYSSLIMMKLKIFLIPNCNSQRNKKSVSRNKALHSANSFLPILEFTW